MSDEDDGETGAEAQSLVVPEGTADAMARAFIRHHHGRAVTWKFYASILLFVTMVAFGLVDRTSGYGAHMLRSVVYATPVVIVLVAVICVMLYRRVRRRVLRDVAPGAELASVFRRDEMVVRTSVGTRQIPYASVTSLAVHDECVVLETRGSPLPWVLPKALFPDEEVARLQAAPSSSGLEPPAATTQGMPARSSESPVAAEADAGGLVLQHGFVIDSSTATRMARVHVAAQHTRPGIWLGHLFLFAVLITILTAPFRGPDEGLSLGVAAALSAGSTGVFACYHLAVLWRSTIRSLRAGLPSGALMETGFGEDAYLTSGPRGRRCIPYSCVETVKRRGDFVFVREVDDPVVKIYPAVLFPGQALARMSSATGRTHEEPDGRSSD